MIHRVKLKKVITYAGAIDEHHPDNGDETITREEAVEYVRDAADQAIFVSIEDDEPLPGEHIEEGEWELVEYRTDAKEAGDASPSEG